MTQKNISLKITLLAASLMVLACTSCYRMPRENDYSVIPMTNNRDLTGEGEKYENNSLPTLNY
jgi:hypothetical protein